MPFRSVAAPGRHPQDRVIFALAIPALGALAADPLYSLIDTAFVGHLGTPQLGALAIGTAAFTASFWLFSFLAYGVTPRVARSVGAMDGHAAGRTGVQALFLALAIGAVVTAAGVAFAHPVVRILGATDAVEEFATPYLRIRMLAAIPVLVAQVGHGWLRGAQDTRTAMYVAAAGASTNVVLDYLFIYPLGWGVEGAAWATVVAQTAAAGTFWSILARRIHGITWRPDWVEMRSLIRVGIDLAVRTGSLLAAMTFATAVAARMGTIELASWQIAMQIFLLLAFTMDSLAIAGQALVGRYLGAADAERASDVGKRLVGLGILLGVVLLVALVVTADSVARLFSGDPQVVRQASLLLMWIAILQPLSAVAFTLDGILLGASDTRFLAASMLGSSCLYAGLAAAALRLGWGLPGLVFGATSWLAARAMTTGWRFVRGRWASVYSSY